MNIALIFAGGTGQRMNSKTKPKQFLELHGKPIIIYTLENFEQHPDIDGIVVVCLSGWIDYLKKLLDKFSITKVTHIVEGGRSGQGSIFNGLKTIHKNFPENSVVLIHDGVRPLINEQLITDNIECVRKNGSAISVSPAIETITVKSENNKVGEIIERGRCELAKAPQSFFLKDIYAAHLKAQSDKYTKAIDSATLMRHYGHELYSVESSPENIKITSPSDFYIFRAIVDAKENSQIFGL
ncbi:MAG TPA: IspD/TarI family cytidylyltransferase [Ruminiclostridium sp.]|nr:IspD/TarI family cytidylyltransferase [Ruminiclostridium sp.]